MGDQEKTDPAIKNARANHVFGTKVFEEKPNNFRLTTFEEKFMTGLAAMIIGVVMVLAVVEFTVIPILELLNIFLLLFLPLLIIGVGVGLFSFGFIQSIWSFKFVADVKQRIQEIKAARAN